MKVTYISILIILNLFNTSICAQKKGKLTYSLVKNDERFGKRESELILYTNNNSSVEFIVDKTLDEMNLTTDDNHDYVIIQNKKGPFIYKNFAQKNLLFSGQVGVRQSFLTNDTLANFKWYITKEKANILGYNCIKAITRFRGRDYIAWYTETVPISNGPWKFCGLPGLILKVYDKDNHFIYQLKSIDFKNKFNEKIIDIPLVYLKDKAISFKTYTVLYKKKMEDYKKLSKVVQTGKDGSYGTVTITASEEMEKF